MPSVHVRPALLDTSTDPCNEAKLQVGSVADIDMGVIKAIADENSICWGKVLEPLEQMMASRVVAHQKDQLATTGPDRCLGLLDLGRKKKELERQGL